MNCEHEDKYHFKARLFIFKRWYFLCKDCKEVFRSSFKNCKIQHKHKWTIVEINRSGVGYYGRCKCGEIEKDISKIASKKLLKQLGVL